MALIQLYQNVEKKWKKILPNYDDILTRLRDKEDSINAVLEDELPYKELLDKYEIPALLNSDNGILFGHEVPPKKMFLIIWKDRKLYTEVMEWDLQAHIATKRETEELNKQRSCQTEQKEEGTEEQKEEQTEESTEEQVETNNEIHTLESISENDD